MKKTLLLALMGGALFSLNAQQLTDENQRHLDETGYIRCMAVENEQMLQAQNPNRNSEEEFEQWMKNEVEALRERRAQGRETKKIYNIPVVVHVLYNGRKENISDAQVFSQIEVMNEDYRRMAGTRGGKNTTGKAVDVEINFCMATIDPDGNPTNGIDRVKISQSSVTSMDQANDLKAQHHWDPKKYLNMYTMKFSGEDVGGLLGYAQFPSGSGLQGMPTDGGSAGTDGVVATYNGFGSKDKQKNGEKFDLLAKYAYGRTMTHEVGHWLGLRHTWGDGKCDKDDFCDDTPTTGKSNFKCDKGEDTCPRLPGKDMVENYMDYTPDDCMDTFTQEQKDRMVIVMEKCVRRKELINSDGCKDLSTGDFTFKSSLSLYPNPATNVINLTSNYGKLDSYKVYSVLGKQVLSKEISSDADLSINTSNLQSGLYFIKVKKASSVATLKFVKK